MDMSLIGSELWEISIKLTRSPLTWDTFQRSFQTVSNFFEQREAFFQIAIHASKEVR